MGVATNLLASLNESVGESNTTATFRYYLPLPTKVLSA